MTATISAKIDNNDKSLFEEICASVGLNVSSAINAFVKATIREDGIPFALKSKSRENEFFSEENQKYLSEQVKLYNEGKLKSVTKTLEELEEMAK